MRFAVCDDELTAREQIVTLLEDYIQSRKLEIEYEVFDNYAELSEQIDQFDLFFVDYMMPEIDGMTFSQNVRNKFGKSKTIIFITAYDEIVYDAFSVQAHRFLTKPLDKFKFYEALDAYLNTNLTTGHIIVQNNGAVTAIDFNDIYYILVDRKELYICTEKEQHLCRRSISSVEEDLEYCDFFRVHRSYLVNMRNIRSFDSKNIEFENGEKIPISTRKYSAFCKAYLKMK